MPFSAPLPVPTIIEVGVANPKAQGQAIISTPTVVISAIVTLPHDVVPDDEGENGDRDHRRYKTTPSPDPPIF